MRTIDIHAHLTPQCFWRATENGGDWHTIKREKDARGRESAIVGGQRPPLPPRAKWTPEERLADMDSLGVDVHVVSPYVGFYNYHLDTTAAVATARATNDEIADMVRARPQRFAGLGTLPMQDVKAAFTELRIVLGHGGGYTCYGIGRMDHAWQVRSEARVHVTQPPSAYLRRFYYDCIVYTEPALRYLIDTVGVDRVVFGTDWPYDMALDWPVAWILGMKGLSQDEKEAILWKNLERLLKL